MKYDKDGSIISIIWEHPITMFMAHEELVLVKDKYETRHAHLSEMLREPIDFENLEQQYVTHNVASPKLQMYMFPWTQYGLDFDVIVMMQLCECGKLFLLNTIQSHRIVMKDAYGSGNHQREQLTSKFEQAKTLGW